MLVQKGTRTWAGELFIFKHSFCGIELVRKLQSIDAAHQKANQGRGKDVWWKSQKDDFPSTLANPAKSAGFALYHRLYGYWMIYQSGHFTCLENRTFALAKDRGAYIRQAPHLLFVSH